MKTGLICIRIVFSLLATYLANLCISNFCCSELSVMVSLKLQETAPVDFTRFRRLWADKMDKRRHTSPDSLFAVLHADRTSHWPLNLLFPRPVRLRSHRIVKSKLSCSCFFREHLWFSSTSRQGAWIRCLQTWIDLHKQISRQSTF